MIRLASGGLAEAEVAQAQFPLQAELRHEEEASEKKLKKGRLVCGWENRVRLTGVGSQVDANFLVLRAETGNNQRRGRERTKYVLRET